MMPQSVLYVGFTTCIFTRFAQEIFITGIDEEMSVFIRSRGIDFTYIKTSELRNYEKAFNAVVAVDEFFTYAADDEEQRQLVSLMCDLAKNVVITTLRDYKNQDFKEKEFSYPNLVRGNDELFSFLELHDWSQTDRNSWKSKIYQISGNDDKLTVYGAFSRKTIFFKQLAKFSHDAGSKAFMVHKNLMYKSLIRKNYEHVISIIIG
jgi:hypothetical protein